MNTDRKKLVLAYLDAVGKQQYAQVAGLLADDLKFKGPNMTRTSAGEVIAALTARRDRSDRESVIMSTGH